MSALKLTPNEQLALQLKMQEMKNLANQAQAANQQNQYNNQLAMQNQGYYGAAGISPYQTTTVATTGTANIVATAMGSGGYGQQTFPNMQSAIFAPLTQPSLDFQVDMIFAAVEKHLRALIKEEIQNALQSLHESET